MNASPRIIKEAKLQAVALCNRIRTAEKRKLISSWHDIESLFAITIPAIYKSQPWSYAAMSGFLMWWENSVEERLSAAIEEAGEQANLIKVDKNVSQFGDLVLYPEQEGTYQAIYRAMFLEKRVKAFLNDGYTGSGKTIVAIAVMARLIQDGLLERPEMKFMLHPFTVFTPCGVPVENWKRECERAGLGKYINNRKIFICPDSIFQTEFGDSYCSIEEDYVTGETKYVWNPMLLSYLTIFDECHRFVREDALRFKKALALVESPVEPHYVGFFSATPVEKVNDARLFTVSCRTKFMNISINSRNFNTFAKSLDATPHKPNAAACGRLRDVLASHIFSIPWVKPKHIAINQVVLIDFLNDRHREVYMTAHQRYIEACMKTGKNTLWGQFEVLVALNNFLKTAEPLRAWWIAERVANNYKNGKLATAVFCSYKETISEVAFRCVDQYGIPRERMSIIWGGKREYKSSEMLSPDEMNRVYTDPDFMAEIVSNKVLRKRAIITMRYMQDQFEHTESAEEQSYRHAKLKELKLLGKQSTNQRQIEVDNFQDGTTIVCLATTATGGISLSLDKNKESLLAREGLYTPPFSGKVYSQALGRLVRRASIADARQYTAMLKGTVEEFKVAPILDSKLKSMASFNAKTMDAIIDLLSEEIPLESPPIHLRDENEARDDALKDDSLITDHMREVDEDDEDDEGTDEKLEALLNS